MATCAAGTRRRPPGAGERSLPCSVPDCTYVAAKRSHLLRHERKHTGERPFACLAPGCGYAASEQGTLNNHMRSRHPEQV